MITYFVGLLMLIFSSSYLFDIWMESSGYKAIFAGILFLGTVTSGGICFKYLIKEIVEFIKKN